MTANTNSELFRAGSKMRQATEQVAKRDKLIETLQRRILGLRRRVAELEAEEADDVTCPWCAEREFDLIGLKSHIENGDCHPYNDGVSVVRGIVLDCHGESTKEANDGGT